MSTDVLHTTDRTALARLENYLRNHDVPGHVIEAFYHMKNSIGTLQYAEEKSREAWQGALAQNDELMARIEVLVNELAHHGVGVR